MDNREQYIHAVEDVTISINKGEILGVTGESGCGKSTLIKVVYGFVDPPLKVITGNVYYYIQHEDGTREEIDITSLDTKILNNLRWSFCTYIPQSSLSVLNPTMRIIDHFLETIKAHTKKFDKKEAEKTIRENIQFLGLPIEILTSFPHQLSGGMRQRVVLALATILKPKIIFADEPTTALDVIVQRSIIQSLKKNPRRSQKHFSISIA